uniref:Uncharacterized protein n=1 Tax=Timema poppense TaxID=170557 RepID=A0A7R9CVY8_TIMPO|nr:unnamed protein product [Timema poppensis]
MNTSSLAGKVIRAPSLKRGKNGEASLGEKVKLERVLGLTVSSNAALDCDPDTELVVYPAGCTVVLFNPIKNRQSHLLNSSRKTITCLALSPDGHYLVTGECGHLPLVRVWDLHEEGSPGVQVAELPSHKYGINCVHLISLKQVLSATEMIRSANAAPFRLSPLIPANTTNVSFPPPPFPNFIKPCCWHMFLLPVE